MYLPIIVSSCLTAGDDDPERKTRAEVLLGMYSRELERRRLEAGAQGLLISGNGLYHAFRIIFLLTF